LWKLQESPSWKLNCGGPGSAQAASAAAQRFQADLARGGETFSYLEGEWERRWPREADVSRRWYLEDLGGFARPPSSLLSFADASSTSSGTDPAGAAGAWQHLPLVDLLLLVDGLLAALRPERFWSAAG